jgi:ribose transport system ATP-binding protein
MAVALAVDEVSKAYGPTQALDRVSLTAPAGGVHALLGGNGSGKSTLIKILAGVVQADAGRVTIGGERFDATSITPSAAHGANCFFVHQDIGVFPSMSVADNLHLGRGYIATRLGRVRWSAVRRRTQALLDQYEIDAEPSTLVETLGPATQTKLAIARALQQRADASQGVLVLDEPTASLPANEVAHLLQALRSYAGAGQAIVFVTHRLTEVCEVADSATVLRNGCVIATLNRDEITPARLTDLIAGEETTHSVAPAPPHTIQDTAPTALDVIGLSGRAITDCSFSVSEGEILGVAGLVGSGSTTLLQLLFGLIPRESGEVKLHGNTISPRSPRDAMSAGLAYVPADRKRDGVFADLSVNENLSAAVIDRYWQRGRLRLRTERDDSRAIIDQSNIRAESERASMSSLSGGNQQKVMLARWSRRQPRILLFDEPTQGVDVGARAAIHTVIRDAVSSGAGAIVASADEEELATICDRVLVLRDGRVSAILTREQISAERIARVAQEGHAVR